MLESKPMRRIVFVAILMIFAGTAYAQNPVARTIYETERAFEKTVAEKGINAGFIEFLTADGLLFNPDVINGREAWQKRQTSPASLTWNPIWIEVSSNGALAYSIGNGVYKPKGKYDTTEYYSHYLSIWRRLPGGEYRAVLDVGINHDKPPATVTDWKSPAVSGNEKLQNSAGDHSVNFYSSAESAGAAKAYKAFLAEDGIIMRDGHLPFIGKKASLGFLENEKPAMKFAKRKSFIEAGDLAWVTAGYSIVDKAGVEVEKGNFIQVWKLRNGKWQIAADVLAPTFKKDK
jgi:ketosteroid isomerase-like protein